MQSAGTLTRIALRPSTIAAIATLILLASFGAFVRFLGIDFGRPFAYHPDEAIIVGSAMDMVHHRDWNPHSFFYSSLLFDVQAVVTGFVRLWGGAPLERDQAWLFGSEALPGQFRYFLAGRLVVAILGLITIIVTFAIGTRMHSVRAGLIAAAVVALAPIHVTSSRYVTTDVPLTLLCALTLLCLGRSPATHRRTVVAGGGCIGRTRHFDEVERIRHPHRAARRVSVLRKRPERRRRATTSANSVPRAGRGGRHPSGHDSGDPARQRHGS